MIPESNIDVTKQWVQYKVWVSKEAERVEPVINGYNNNIRRLVDPVLKRPVSRVAVDIACNSSMSVHA